MLYFNQYLSAKMGCISLLVAMVVIGCKNQADNRPRTGIWRGTLLIQEKYLPFNFEVTRPDPKTYQIHLINGTERITSDDVRIRGDSMFATLHIFDTQLTARLSKKSMAGVWRKNYSEGYNVPFNARYGKQYRFTPGAQPSSNITGRWQVNFSKDSLTAVGIFDQKGSEVLGTFLTTTGDYRYLEGSVVGDSLLLSAFDGEHAFLFTARIQPNGNIQGEFRSGNHWFESWSAVPDATAQLIDRDSITVLKPGYQGINFTFPDLNGRFTSLTDEKFSSKVMVLQLFGSWCPNCMDETKFLSNWYNSNRHQPVEIIGLAYERLEDFSYAKSRLNKMALKFDINYQLLIAGTSDKDQASETLPMLNHISAFPTTIFIDHKGIVRKIHTGFLGPGSGQYFEDFSADFDRLINDLVLEKLADTTQLEM